MFLFWFLYNYHHKPIKHPIQSFLKSSILVQMVLYFSNSLSSSIHKDINLLYLFLSPPLSLNIWIYPFILGNIKTNGLITYLNIQLNNQNCSSFQLFFRWLYYQHWLPKFSLFFYTLKFFICYFYLIKSPHYYTIKKNFVIIFPRFYIVSALILFLFWTMFCIMIANNSNYK